jgi:hypothetical protein
MISSEQVRAARALLRWEQKTLAETSGISLPSIKRLEAQPGALAAQGRTVHAIQRALEAAGVEFLNHGRPGVRMTAPHEVKAMVLKIDKGWSVLLKWDDESERQVDGFASEVRAQKWIADGGPASVRKPRTK